MRKVTGHGCCGNWFCSWYANWARNQFLQKRKENYFNIVPCYSIAFQERELKHSREFHVSGENSIMEIQDYFYHTAY